MNMVGLYDYISVIVQYDFHHDMHLDSSWHIISLIALYKLLDRVLCNKKRLKLNAMLLPSINLFCFQHDVMEKQIELHFSFVYLYHALALKCGWGTRESPWFGIMVFNFLLIRLNYVNVGPLYY